MPSHGKKYKSSTGTTGGGGGGGVGMGKWSVTCKRNSHKVMFREIRSSKVELVQ